jgi:NADH-quinone oxidoreductase subunit N
MTWADALLLLPEVILAAGACVMLLAPFFAGSGRRGTAKWALLVLLGITAASVVLISSPPSGEYTQEFVDLFVVDGFAIFFKFLFIVIVALVALLSEDFLARSSYSPWEYYALIAFALCGMFFMASGVHLISIYVGLELLSLSSYILAGYFKGEGRSTEAAMKYFILGSASSAILLYGISLIYGVCGSLQLDAMARAMAGMSGNDALMIGVMFLGAGLCFKVAAVPFHVWTPDVYVGAPTPITAFLSTASKAAAFAIFARIFYTALPGIEADWSAVIAMIAALSMVVGNLAAVTQDNIKRMLAYSSIGHAGYVMLGILAMSEIGLQGVLIYMLVYAFATLGIWAAILMMRQHEYAGEQIEDFAGLHRRAPAVAFAMVVFLLSLGGIPPTAGFIGKYFLFASAISAGYAWLAVIAVLMSAVSMFYYLRVVVAMYLKEGRVAEIEPSPRLRLTVAICLVATLVLGILPETMVKGVRESIGSVVQIAQK